MTDHELATKIACSPLGAALLCPEGVFPAEERAAHWAKLVYAHVDALAAEASQRTVPAKMTSDPGCGRF